MGPVGRGQSWNVIGVPSLQFNSMVLVWRAANEMMVTPGSSPEGLHPHFWVINTRHGLRLVIDREGQERSRAVLLQAMGSV